VVEKQYSECSIENQYSPVEIKYKYQFCVEKRIPFNQAVRAKSFTDEQPILLMRDWGLLKRKRSGSYPAPRRIEAHARHLKHQFFAKKNWRTPNMWGEDGNGVRLLS